MYIMSNKIIFKLRLAVRNPMAWTRQGQSPSLACEESQVRTSVPQQQIKRFTFLKSKSLIYFDISMSILIRKTLST